jgi:hypothetical protein
MGFASSGWRFLSYILFILPTNRFKGFHNIFRLRGDQTLRRHRFLLEVCMRTIQSRCFNASTVWPGLRKDPTRPPSHPGDCWI